MDMLSLRFDGHTHVLHSLDMAEVSLDRPRVALPDGAELDEFGVVWRGGAPVNAPVPGRAALEGYRFPAPQEEFLRERMETLDRAEDGRLRVCTLHTPLLSRAEALAGRGALRRSMTEDPDFAHALLLGVCGQTLAVMETAMQFSLDALCLTEDWTLPPELWRGFVRPCLARLYAMVKAYGRPVIQRGGGAFLPELEALGLDVLWE